MSNLVCGRCGNPIAPGSTYCPTDRWTLYREAPEQRDANAAGVAPVELPPPPGFLERRRHEGQRAQLEREFHAFIDTQLQAAEEQLEDNHDNARLQHRLGLLSLLDDRLQRANAHFERAHKRDANDLETSVNYAISLARRGQTQPALALLEETDSRHPDTPVVLLNLAVAALQTRRPEIVLKATASLERLWHSNLEIAIAYHDTTMSLRGLALLMLDRKREAEAALLSAARHQVNLNPLAPAAPTTDHKNAVADGTSAPIATAMESSGSSSEAQEDNWDDVALMEAAVENATEHEEPVQLPDSGDNADLLNNLAIAEAESGQAGRAMARLGAALRLDAAHLPALNNLAVLAYQHGQYGIALKYLQMAYQIEEASGQHEAHTYNHLGAVLTVRGRLKEALEMFDRAGSHERAEFEVFYNLGRAYVEHGKPDKGVSYLRHAFSLEPHHADLHAVLGAAYLLRGQEKLLPEALKHLKRALQLNPSDRTAFTNLVLALHETGNHEASIKALTQALKTQPDNAATLFQLAVIMMQQGGEAAWSKAGTQFGALYAKRPDLIACLYNEALCQYLLGLRDAAARQLERVTKLDEAFAPAYYLLGLDYATSRKWDEALAAWLKAVKYEPNNADLQANIGYIYFIREDFRKAVSHYMQAHRLLPANAEILAMLGLCFARANMLRQAITAFQQSLALNPNSAITHSNLGLAFYLFKQVEAAMEEWRTVSQLDSNYAARREEEQYRTYDNSIVQLRPLNWPSRIVSLSPPLPPPHTRLVPGYNARTYHPVINDPEIKKAAETKKALDYNNRLIAAMSLRS